MFVQDIIIAPVITEKSMIAAREKKYTFKVDKKATKIDVKRAVEIMFNNTTDASKFDVRVKDVNIINVRGQFRRYGKYSGYTESWKKAVVTLTEASKTIDFFDGML